MRNLLYLFSAILIASISGCVNKSEKPKDDLISSYPDTEIIAEEPLIIGNIIKVKENEQVIAIVENITKQETIDWYDSKGDESSDVYWLFSNRTKFEGKFGGGNKVAIWKSGIGAEKTGEIAKRIILLEK